MCRLIFTLPLVLSVFSNSAIAAILIEVQSVLGGNTQVMMEGNKSRVDMGDQEYVLIDKDMQTMFTVVPEQKQILNMSGNITSSDRRSAPRIKTELIPQGRGPSVAGYPTERFTLKANGKFCGTLLGSKVAMQTTGIASLFDSIKAMADKQRDALGSYAALMDDCTRANMELASLAGQIGVPMKMLDSRGNTVSEIKNIDTRATLPADIFTLPQGYKMISMGNQNNTSRQGVSQAQRQIPDRPQVKRYRAMMPQPR